MTDPIALARPRPSWRRAALLAALGLALAGCGGKRDAGSKPVAGADTICGDSRIKGAVVGEVGADAPIAACGADDAVRVVSVSGVRIAPAATVNCKVARGLADWIDNGVQPAAKRAFGRPVAELKNAASYACRSRNNQPGARLSEHSFANAIDISVFRLAEKGFVPVSGGWSDPRSADFLKAVWRSACGPFATVLGPDGDAFHQDHFHFDAAERRTPFCR